jgi:hypothetical protein
MAAMSLRGWPALVSLTLLAVAVLSLAWPRFLANVRYLPVERAIKGYYESGEIPSARLADLIQFAEEAIDQQDHYRFHQGLSTLHLLRAMDFRTPALERRGAYISAMDEAGQALQRAPANPETWLRLASVRWILHEEPETIVDAWKMSVFTGRMHTALFAKRVEMGLAYYEYLDEEGQAMLRDQLQLAWRLRPQGLMRVMQRRDSDLAITRWLLAPSDPALVSEIETWFEKRRR